MKSFFTEFKEFITRGNVMDLAIAVIIGGAFQAIIKSLTDDIISPIIGIFGNADFSAWVLTIRGVDIKYGSFITAVINFIIMALIVFLIMKAFNKLANLRKKPEDQVEMVPDTKVCPICKTEIPLEAVRCPHCTSVLDKKKVEELIAE